MPPVGFQLRLAGASRADAAAQAGHGLSHAGELGQKVLVLRQLHLEPAFLGLGALGKDIENQGAAIEHRGVGEILQGADLGGRQVVVTDEHGGLCGLDELADLLGLALAKEAVGIGGGAVLEHLGRAGAAGGLQKRLQLVQGFIGGRLRPVEHVRVQTGQDGLFHLGFLECLHKSSKFRKNRKKPAPNRCGRR